MQSQRRNNMSKTKGISKKKKLLKCKILTRTKIYKKKELPTLELLKKVLGKDFNLCPHCKKGHMLIPNTS